MNIKSTLLATLAVLLTASTVSAADEKLPVDLQIRPASPLALELRQAMSFGSVAITPNMAATSISTDSANITLGQKGQSAGVMQVFAEPYTVVMLTYSPGVKLTDQSGETVLEALIKGPKPELEMGNGSDEKLVFNAYTTVDGSLYRAAAYTLSGVLEVSANY